MDGTLCETEEEKEEINKLEKKEHNKRLFIDRLIKEIRILFEQQEEEDYYKPERVNNFWNN